MKSTQKYRSSIFGETYSLVSDESEEVFLASVDVVDKLMREIAASSGLSDSKRIAVLAAVQLANQLKQTEQVLAHYKKQESVIAKLLEHELQDVLQKDSCGQLDEIRVSLEQLNV